ncbi:type II toxin-antitoxin system RelE/ParE family toxin [Geminocystis sp. CENA526]|uniref:type II toxin-antitoxin system RelE/ParE family toxin n=1 Tax=Geminocystis sp. CENA526 TaxID=1355871 RepID=UPI003D6DD912
MSNPNLSIEFSDEFKHNLVILAKKYRSIRNDIQPILEKLKSGELIGDKIPNINYTVFKVRVKNSDIKKGKSSGYRLIYYLKTSTKIILITIYSKSDQASISAKEIRKIITNFS